MSEDKNKTDLNENFKDFEDEHETMPTDIYSLNANEEELKSFEEANNSIQEVSENILSAESNISDEDFFEQQQNQIQKLLNEIDEENIDHLHDEIHEFHNGDPDHENHWSNEENSAIKKYIVYISKDFVPYIDELTIDERSAYINDAIQKKLDEEDAQKRIDKKKKLLFNFLVMFITILLISPIAIFVINKSIIATFENYKYSQDSFEKLYKQRFTNSKTYQRSVQYNRLHSYK